LYVFMDSTRQGLLEARSKEKALPIGAGPGRVDAGRSAGSIRPS